MRLLCRGGACAKAGRGFFPSRIPFEVLEKVVAAGFELVADESQAEHPAAESVLGVVGGCPAVNRFLRGHRLMHQGDTKLYGSLNLSRMERCVVTSELDCSALKKCVVVCQVMKSFP